MSDALAAFAALGQPVRLNVLRLLIKAGPDGMAAGEVSRALDVRQNTLSVNLSVLVAAGLVSRTREGRVIRYFADMSGVRELVAFLTEDCCGGRKEICGPLLDEIACAC